MHIRLRIWHLLFCLVAALLGSAIANAQVSSYSGTCANGAPASEQFCQFFLHYNKINNTPLDTRIADALQIKTASETRSIGLIISIGKYPNMPGHDLPAAEVDGDRLYSFLVDKQNFDEVIVLKDDQATEENIKYFLEEYLPNRAADFDNKARVLIAYSGHGRYGESDGSTDAMAGFVLSAARDMNGSSNVYKMQEFAAAVEILAKRYFHVLTLINACYGGGFFKDGVPGGNADSFTERGSYAITAGSKKDPVPSLIEKRGSLFFDLLIEGVTRGKADPLYWDVYSTVSENGTTVEQRGVTRTNALSTYLISTYARIVHDRSSSDPNFHLSSPWIGPTQKDVALGGFFFLSDHDKGSTTDITDIYKNPQTAEAASFGFGPKQSPITLPPGPISSVVGRPDIKVFKAPDIYPVHGFDFSSADGTIDWQTFAVSEHPRFAYARAMGWRGPDRTFEERWSHIKALGINYGAYVKFDFCRSPAEQLEMLSQIVPVDPQALPMGIEIVNPKGEDEEQLACFKGMSIDQAKTGIITLATNVRERYGKTPLLYGNRNNLSTFIDERGNTFMIWLGSYGAEGIQLRGGNPWTLWQYSGTLNVKGVGPKTTGEVFFGTEQQYDLFKKGRSNIALQAVEK
jgi:GH25 family lysozyme M1 (1,4-beta-N-acetylmuramidase)